ncbi:hypothetical protein DdX_22475 [Ditylenchus destructor]|uniref:Uncharacterized protein n=1 Tax=Ditylenchus destructor TaxID=166010 RepID=A0AAD4MFQ4_9BILA|nr:hypothetical protein DdX_22475 [Ditylenchus destructor]
MEQSSYSDLIYSSLKLKFELLKAFEGIFDYLYITCWDKAKPPDGIVYDMHYHLQPHRALACFSKQFRKEMDKEQTNMALYTTLLSDIEELEKYFSESFDTVIFIAVEEGPCTDAQSYGKIREFVHTKFLDKPFKEIKDKLNSTINNEFTFDAEKFVEEMFKECL